MKLNVDDSASILNITETQKILQNEETISYIILRKVLNKTLFYQRNTSKSKSKVSITETAVGIQIPKTKC